MMNRAALGVFGILTIALLLTPIVLAEQSQLSIPANGRSTVLTLDLKKGDSVAYTWSANNSVTFRVQNSTGDNLVDREGQTGSGSFQAPADGTYTFQFRNNNNFPVQVQWTIERQGILPATTVYLIIGVAVAALAAAAVLMMRRRQPSK